MRIRCALLTLAILATACGDGGGGTAAINEEPDSTNSSTTTAAPATTTAAPPTTTTEQPPPPSTTAPPEPVLFTERGPWAVGIATLDLGDRQADVYYPCLLYTSDAADE